MQKGGVFFIMVYQFNTKTSNDQDKSCGNRHAYQYDYDWIDDLSDAVDVLTSSMVLPKYLTDELSSISVHLSEIYIEACRWEEKWF